MESETRDRDKQLKSVVLYRETLKLCKSFGENEGKKVLKTEAAIKFA